MKILAIDIGTGTQDIFLYDSRLDLENGYKMVVPSPTLQINRRLRAALEQQCSVVLTGSMMGGGPSTWGVEQLLKNGLTVYAVPQAARSLNDDLSAVERMGVTLVSGEEAAALPGSVERVEMRDFDFPLIERAFRQFGILLDDLAAVAVGVFDHGNAPPEMSDRQFRFDYLNERITALRGRSFEHPADSLGCFAFPAGAIPVAMTRMQAVADSARAVDAPLVVMDTAPAAVWGASFDEKARSRLPVIFANIGNMHTLAFRLGPQGVEGVFEHHTGLLTTQEMDALLRRLADGTLKHEEVFSHHGHGALLYTAAPMDLPPEFGVVVTGPRRGLMAGSHLCPYYPASFGDMMISGCFGLLAAAAETIPAIRDEVRRSLLRTGTENRAPWDL